MAVKVSGTWRDTKAWWVKVSGTWREGAAVWTKVSGVWRKEAFVEPLVATLSPQFVSGFSGGGVATTGYCTTSVSGGVAPYSYLWQKVGGSTMTVLTSTAFRTKFSSGSSGTGLYRCRITDSNSTVTFTQNVTVDIEIEEL